MPSEILVRADTSQAASGVVGPSMTLTTLSAGIVVASPVILREDQLYYWTHAWQVGEAESQADIDKGDTERFANADDAIRWLFSNDQ